MEPVQIQTHTDVQRHHDPGRHHPVWSCPAPVRCRLGSRKLVVGSLLSIGVWVFEPVAGLIALSGLVRQDLAVGGLASLEADEVGMADALGTRPSVNTRFTL